jgi:hypothetical protein
VVLRLLALPSYVFLLCMDGKVLWSILGLLPAWLACHIRECLLLLRSIVSQIIASYSEVKTTSCHKVECNGLLDTYTNDTIYICRCRQCGTRIQKFEKILMRLPFNIDDHLPLVVMT